MPKGKELNREKISSRIKALRDIDADTINRLLYFLAQPADKLSVFPLVRRLDAANRIAAMIENPFCQFQYLRALCGPNALCIGLAFKIPAVFVHVFLTLLERGEVFFPIHLTTTTAMRRHVHIELILYDALKQLNNAYFDPTFPYEIVEWMRLLGCTEIHNSAVIRILGWQYHPSTSKYSYEEQLQVAARATDECKDEHLSIILLRGSFAFAKIENENYGLRARPCSAMLSRVLECSGLPISHYVYLRRFDFCQNNQVRLVLYTWGAESVIWIQKNELKKHWLGLITCKLPLNLLTMTGSDCCACEPQNVSHTLRICP